MVVIFFHQGTMCMHRQGPAHTLWGFTVTLAHNERRGQMSAPLPLVLSVAFCRE